MPVLAMLIARFAAGLLRPRLGRAFGERGGLSFAGAFLVVEPPFEIGDALQEFRDDAIAFDATSAWPSVFVHAGSLGKRMASSCAETSLSGGFFSDDR